MTGAAPDFRPARNRPATVLFASLIGTTIEFFDFYIYATAAVLVFPKLFFPAGDAAAATLQSLATFAIAFFARPVGSAVFGHFGDRIGRKATLVAALLTMGISTVVIGLLPTYASIGTLAPLLLAVFTVSAILMLAGISLTIMHLIGMLLIIAIGSNYALFFDRRANDPHPFRLRLCCADTLG